MHAACPYASGHYGEKLLLVHIFNQISSMMETGLRFSAH